MAPLSPDIVDQVVEACRAGAAEAALAFGRAFGTQFSLSLAGSGSIDAQALPDELAGPGLAIVLTVGESAALVVLSESSGLLPPWYTDPDPTGQSKLGTLAQELGAILLPEEYMPDEFRAGSVENLAEAAARAGVPEGGAVVRLQLQTPDGSQAPV